MQVYENGLILGLIRQLWSLVCARFSGGLFSRAASALANRYRRGLLYHVTVRGGETLSESWEGSFLRRALERLLNLIPALLRRLCPSAERSLFIGAASRYTVPVFCVMIFAMLIIPQDNWNNLYSLALACLALLFYWCAVVKSADRRISLKYIGPWPCIYASVVFLSLLWSDSFDLSLRFIFFAATSALCVIVFTNAFDSEKKLLAFVLALGAGLLVSSAYAVYQRITGVESSSVLTDLTLNADMPGRVYSFFENPNSYANLLVYFSPLALCMFFFAPKRWQRVGFGLVFLLCALALIMTYSRGGWLAFAFSIFVLMCLLCPRWIPLVMLCCVLCLPLLPDSILNRLLTIFNLSDSSTYTRTYIYAAMLRIIKQSPLFGVGLGADTVKHSIEIAGAYTAEAVFIHGHNIYLQVWAESGLLGLLSLIFSVFLAMRGGGRRLKKPGTTPLLRGIIAGCVSGLSGSLFFGLTDYPWSYPRVMVMFWLLFALLCTAARLSKENEKAGNANVQ